MEVERAENAGLSHTYTHTKTILYRGVCAREVLREYMSAKGGIARGGQYRRDCPVNIEARVRRGEVIAPVALLYSRRKPRH